MGRELHKETNGLKCAVCRVGETSGGEATVTLTKDDLTLVVKRVPAEICSNCGEEYVCEEVGRRLLESAHEASKAGVQVDIRSYAA